MTPDPLATVDLGSRMRGDRGSAAIEFLTMGLLLLVPLIYLVLTLSALQGASFAAEGAARQAARVAVLAPTDAAARARAASAVQVGAADWKIAATASSLTLTCAPDPTNCVAPQGQVTASVRVAVTLPFLPPALHISSPGTIVVHASAVQRVSMFQAASR